MRTVFEAATQENETGTGARGPAKRGAENGPNAAGGLTNWPTSSLMNYDETTTGRRAIHVVNLGASSFLLWRRLIIFYNSYITTPFPFECGSCRKLKH